MMHLKFETVKELGNFVQGYCWSNTDHYPFYRWDGNEYESDDSEKLPNDGVQFKEDII